jgi:hypothetical protein
MATKPTPRTAVLANTTPLRPAPRAESPTTRTSRTPALAPTSMPTMSRVAPRSGLALLLRRLIVSFFSPGSHVRLNAYLGGF